MSVRDWFEKRKTIILKEPLIARLGSSHSIRIDREVDSDIERMRVEKVREWRARGYPEHLIDMALRLSQEWVISMAKAFAPTMTEVQSAIIKATFPKALQVGQKWLEAIIK